MARRRSQNAVASDTTARAASGASFVPGAATSGRTSRFTSATASSAASPCHSASAPRAPTRTTTAVLPPFRKYSWTASASGDPLDRPPKLRSNSSQSDSVDGTSSGPSSARPTNAATAVPTPSMGLAPLSSTPSGAPGASGSGTRHRLLLPRDDRDHGRLDASLSPCPASVKRSGRSEAARMGRAPCSAQADAAGEVVIRPAASAVSGRNPVITYFRRRGPIGCTCAEVLRTGRRRVVARGVPEPGHGDRAGR